MNHLLYITAAYGITLFGLGLFLAWTFIQWKKSIAQEKDSRDTLLFSNNKQEDEARGAERIFDT